SAGHATKDSCAGEGEVDDIEKAERLDNPADPVDEDVAAQDRSCAQGAEPHAAHGQRDEGDNDQGVEDHRGQHGRAGAVQVHDIERAELRVGGDEQGGDDHEVLRDVVGDREGGQRAPGDDELLADLDDVDELGRAGVEVDHVAGFLGRGGADVHGHP